MEKALLLLGNGFLHHPANANLRLARDADENFGKALFPWLLRLIYRILFLMVVEERKLIFTPGTDPKKRDIYYRFYSVYRLRKRCETPYFSRDRHHDLWIGLNHTFSLFHGDSTGLPLEIKPLGGELFGADAIGPLSSSRLRNNDLLEALRCLSLFPNPRTGTVTRVNYGSLNVEEFGSVYEGLLEYEPTVWKSVEGYEFKFWKGTERSATGSHYTPDELVQPLIRHSLDYIIREKLAQPDREKALLSIRVCDVACGSGHILLNAARRIGMELARVRTGLEQPGADAIRKGVRLAINHCIYGVDKNPLAVELCKVSLWLEAHNPGEPLNFLDHHIKCGDAVVGLAHQEELQKGIPDEAFKTMPGDDKEVAAAARKQNKKERDYNQTPLNFKSLVQDPVLDFVREYRAFAALPEDSPMERERKKTAYLELTRGDLWQRLKALADMNTAQFFIPKTPENAGVLVTDSGFRQYLAARENREDNDENRETHETRANHGYPVYREAEAYRFFHWFLEFPEIFAEGGFDCILGNPPFLGNRKIKSHLGAAYLEWLTYYYAPAGAIDVVGYFFRRIFALLKPNGFQALIATNTIAQGTAREGGLEIIEKEGGTIHFALRSMRWPGTAAVEVSLLSIFKGKWTQPFILDHKKVERISTYLDDMENPGNPFVLTQNADKSFQGSIVLGKGFILTPGEATRLIESNPKNRDVLFPYLTGDDLNSSPEQIPSRWIINFFDWPEEKARDQYPECFEILEKKVKPERQRTNNKGEYVLRKPLPQRWWQYADKRPKLYRTIESKKRVIIINRYSKIPVFSLTEIGNIYSDSVVVITIDSLSFFSILNSELHLHWAWKQGSTMRAAGIRYTPSTSFETFPFPQNLTPEHEPELERIGEEYHEFRRGAMLRMQLGLTKLYNQFHNRRLAKINGDGAGRDMAKEQGKETANLWNHLELMEKSGGGCSFNEAVEAVMKLRELQREMDVAVLRAYGWTDIALAHDFYEVDYLQEGDRERYTIAPESRKEILRRLLALNHEIHRQEIETAASKPLSRGDSRAADGSPAKNRKSGKSEKNGNGGKTDGEGEPGEPGKPGPVQRSFDFSG